MHENDLLNNGEIKIEMCEVPRIDYITIILGSMKAAMENVGHYPN